MNVKAVILGNSQRVAVHFVAAKLDPQTEEVVREPTYKSFPENTDASAYEVIARKLTGKVLDGTIYTATGSPVSERGLTVIGTFSERQKELPSKGK